MENGKWKMVKRLGQPEFFHLPFPFTIQAGNVQRPEKGNARA
jgi:hypothetical protein